MHVKICKAATDVIRLTSDQDFADLSIILANPLEAAFDDTMV